MKDRILAKARELGLIDRAFDPDTSKGLNSLHKVFDCFVRASSCGGLFVVGFEGKETARNLERFYLEQLGRCGAKRRVE